MRHSSRGWMRRGFSSRLAWRYEMVTPISCPPFHGLWTCQPKDVTIYVWRLTRWRRPDRTSACWWPISPCSVVLLNNKSGLRVVKASNVRIARYETPRRIHGISACFVSARNSTNVRSAVSPEKDLDRKLCMLMATVCYAWPGLVPVAKADMSRCQANLGTQSDFIHLLDCLPTVLRNGWREKKDGLSIGRNPT